MKFYIQFDESGNITGTVSGNQRPEHPRMLEFEDVVSWANKKVDIETGELVDLPIEEEDANTY